MVLAGFRTSIRSCTRSAKNQDHKRIRRLLRAPTRPTRAWVKQFKVSDRGVLMRLSTCWKGWRRILDVAIHPERVRRAASVVLGRFVQ